MIGMIFEEIFNQKKLLMKICTSNIFISLHNKEVILLNLMTYLKRII